MKYEAKKIKLMDFTFPFEITPIVTWTIWKLQISLSCEFRVSEIIEQRQALPPDYFHLDFCAATPSIWWDGIYCLWDWWKITRVFSPSIRKSNVALMLWYGEKSDLALGSGMFLVRLWWVGPGRGHMKGSLCQAAKMFSLSLMKTRTHIQIGEHACHTLYKHQGYNTVDSHGLLSLFFKGGQSEKHVCSVIKRQQDTEAKLPHPKTDRQYFSPSLFFFSSAALQGTWFPGFSAWKMLLHSIFWIQFVELGLYKGAELFLLWGTFVLSVVKQCKSSPIASTV